MKQKVKLTGIAVTGVASIAMLAGFTPVSAATGSMHKPTWVAHPPIHVKSGATATYQTGYTPAQIRGAYALSGLQNGGAGVTVAIVDAYGSPTIQNDLATFDSQFSLPQMKAGQLNVVSLTNRSNAGWALETSLDVEWVHALAPNANIMLVEAKSASLTDLLNAISYATSHGAQVVSNSWGSSEFSGESSYDSYFNNPGVVYTASSGDNGAGVDWPAVSPNVVGVGGTSLTINNPQTNPTYGGEKAWSGSGGGISAYEPVPSFQTFGYSGRAVPDVSWVADPNTGVAIYDSTNYQGQSGWYQIGGTSVGAPSWAALIADVDSSLVGTNQVYNSAEMLKALYADQSYGTYFHDITSGSNGTYSAGQGYDPVTGIGTPIGSALLSELVSQGGNNTTVTSTGGGGGGTTGGGGNGGGKGHGKP